MKKSSVEKISPYGPAKTFAFVDFPDPGSPLMRISVFAGFSAYIILLQLLQSQRLIVLFMAYNLINSNRLFFSIFKKKLLPLKAEKYNTPQQFYRTVESFEQGLEHLQKLKMPKALEDMKKQFKRLTKQSNKKVIDVEMKLTYTYDNYSQQVDEFIFGTEQIEKNTNLEEIHTLTQHMIRYDLNNYIQDLIPASNSHFNLHDRFVQRFKLIQERLSREIYQGYFGFSQNISKLAFLQERQYKGDFKFRIIDEIPKLQKCIDVIYQCAMFNKMRDKLSLASQLAITKYEILSSDSVRKLLFSLASSGRSLKFIEQNIFSIQEKIAKQYPFQFLFYLIMNGMENAIWFESISNNLTIKTSNIHEMIIAKILQLILKEKYNCHIKLEEQTSIIFRQKINQAEQYFQDFLKRYCYTYEKSRVQQFPLNIYTIQQKKFLCFNGLFIKDDNFIVNGLGMIVKQYFMDRNESIKHLNWPRMLYMDKRGLKDQYILSKFKGIDRPKKIKVRYYD